MTQHDRIRQYISDWGSITPMEAFSDLGITKLSTRIGEMIAAYSAIEKGARFGFPVTAFKQAAISAAYRSGWVKDKVSLRGAFFIESDENGMIEIHSDSPVMREDMVRIGQGKADLRYRGEFRNWYADIVIDYNENGQYSLENILNIIHAGGFLCGVGECRPEKDGHYGMFHVEAI